MSIFSKLWKGVKKVGGSIGKIFKKKGANTLLNAAAQYSDSVQSPAYGAGSLNDYAAQYEKEQKSNGALSNIDWAGFINGTKPIDLNNYVKLPDVPVKPSVNWIVIAGVALAAVMIAKKGRK